MDYRALGRSGLWVSPICLGTMTFGARTELAEAERIAASAQDAGVNFIDTADQYSFGASEEMVGRLIKARRHDWVLATKVGNPMSDRPNEAGLGRKWMLRAIEESLRRLATDFVDIYYLHLDWPEIPLEETLSAVGDILRAGKARYYGLSNYRGWRIGEVVHCAARLGLPRPLVCQPYYNAMDRQPEVEILPACAHHGLGVVPYSPLARGVLTGKYRPDRPPPAESRAGLADSRMMETEYRRESLLIAQKIAARAKERGMTAGQWAFNWVLANPLVDSVLAGPRTFEQWRDYLGALDHVWSEEDEAFLDGLVAPGHPSTPGYSDPKYAITGRPQI